MLAMRSIYIARSDLQGAPQPPTGPDSRLVVSIVPPVDQMRERMMVAIYHQIGSKFWVLGHAVVNPRDLMAAIGEQEVLVVPEVGMPRRGARIDWLRVILCVYVALSIILLIIAVMGAQP